MSLHVTIELSGPPRGKGRPRATRDGHVYTDEKTRTYEAQLRYAAQQAMAGRATTADPVSVSMIVRFAIPQTWSKKKKAAALLNHIRPTVKPDVDNTLKLTDALNGVVWADDKQVVDARVRKIYSEMPGLLIEVHSVGAHGVELPRSARRTLDDLLAGSAAA